jgi:hypothetical protein
MLFVFGFHGCYITTKQRPQCVLCLSILAADSMKPNEPNRHLEMKYSEMKNKIEGYSHRKLEILIQQKTYVNTTTVSCKFL